VTKKKAVVGLTVASLAPDPVNRRTHTPRNVSMIADALRKVGASRSIVIDERNEVLAGNGVVEAAAVAGISKLQIVDVDGDTIVAVRRKNLTPDQKRDLAIYDNRTAELAEWNVDQLAADVAAGLDLSPFFFEDEVRDLFGHPSSVAGRPDPDTVPPERPTSIVRGDLFALGRHRLLCGDSTDPMDLTRLMAAESAALCFTSPPYAEQRKKQYGGIAEDDYVQWFGTVQTAFRPWILSTGHFVLNIKPHAIECQRRLYVFDLVSWLVRSAGWLWVDEFCWLRTGIPQQVVHRFKNAFEPCYWFALSDDYLWYPEAVRHASDSVPIAFGKGAGDTNAAKRQGNHRPSIPGRGGGALPGNMIAAGLAYPSNVLNLKQNADALGHPAAFPVQLPSFFLSCLTKVDDVVLDPFGGSGTTLIAADALNRRARLVEISPSYCQMVIDRWERISGQKSEKVSVG
jgi:DNA modification methylase